MYHVNNPTDIISGSRPNITEIGPFVYRVYRRKVKMKQNDKCSIQYALYKRYQFDEEKTRELCKECKTANQTYFTTINAAYVGLQQTLRESFGTTLSYGIFDVYVEQKLFSCKCIFQIC